MTVIAYKLLGPAHLGHSGPWMVTSYPHRSVLCGTAYRADLLRGSMAGKGVGMDNSPGSDSQLWGLGHVFVVPQFPY